ncbi:hypothetical protein [Flavobacterium sp.]|jgi:hypothetical protein|uniref:hypothetical protein n=1 Tax=Flavobacterium sp. TaxID=239 RepID=UPI0037BF85E2
MIIGKKRIRNLELYWHLIEDNSEFCIAVNELERYREKLIDIGFSQDLELGETILPKVIGPVSRFNAEGRNERQKHLPMETAYRQTIWKWKKFIGGGEVEEEEGIRDVPYQCYPIKFIAPRSHELTIAEVENQKVIISSRILKSEENSINARDIFNLFFEIFGECMMLNNNLSIVKIPEIQRKNWSILPPGKYPFEKLIERVNTDLGIVQNRNRKVINHRVQQINDANPNFIAFGNAGFTGYWIFGFPNINTYVLESVYPNNATYILANDWEAISRLSKSEILRNDLHLARIEHRINWPNEINRFLR